MDYRVILSRPALRDLGEISRYIAQDNPSAAERVGLELDRVQRVWHQIFGFGVVGSSESNVWCQTRFGRLGKSSVLRFSSADLVSRDAASSHFLPATTT
jgi:hypothetical protein